LLEFFGGNQLNSKHLLSNSLSDIVDNTNVDVTTKIQYFFKEQINAPSVWLLILMLLFHSFFEMLIVDGPSRESNPGSLGVS